MVAGQAAGDFQLKDAGARLELRGDIDCRRHANANGHFEFLIAALFSVSDEVVAVMSRSEANGNFVL
jgi:hypothetical protein